VKRGDVVIVPLRGDFGKTRPCVVVQSNRYRDDFESVVVCPLSTEIEATHILRIQIDPTESNGLHSRSVVMTDKIIAILPNRIRERVGVVDQTTMDKIDFALALLLDLNRIVA
jgi:mRNA interferase MazF